MHPLKSLRLAKRMHSQVWPGSHANPEVRKKVYSLEKQVFYQKEVIAAREERVLSGNNTKLELHKSSILKHAGFTQSTVKLRCNKNRKNPSI